MANALLTRRRNVIGASSGWTPKQLTSVQAWWRGDDIAGLGNGASISSWTDKSGNGNTLVAGTAAPTVATSAIGGQPAAAFNGTTQFLTHTGLGTIPNVGPCFVYIIGNCTSSGSQAFISARDASRSEWMVYSNAGSLTWFEGGVGSLNNGSVGSSGLYIAGMGGAGDSNNVYVTRNNYQPGFPAKGTLAAPNITSQASVAINVGAENSAGVFLNGQIAELIITSVKPTASELRSLARYVWDRYGVVTGSGYNATAAWSPGVGNYDGSNQVIEADLIYDPASTFGHPFWIGYVPTSTNEDPSVFYADTVGGTLTAPQTNPLVAHRAGGTNADPHLRLQNDGKWYLYYSVGNDNANNGTFVISTTDPRSVAWSAATKILPTTTAEEFVAVWDGTGYVGFSCTGAGFKNWGRQSTPNASWTSSTTCTLTIPGSRAINTAGEFDVRVSSDGSKFILAVLDADSASNIWFASSPINDGINWTFAKYPTLVPNPFGFDSSHMYRPSFTYDASAGNYRVLYTAQGGSGNQMGYTVIDKTEVEV